MVPLNLRSPSITPRVWCWLWPWQCFGNVELKAVRIHAVITRKPWYAAFPPEINWSANISNWGRYWNLRGRFSLRMTEFKVNKDLQTERIKALTGNTFNVQLKCLFRSTSFIILYFNIILYYQYIYVIYRPGGPYREKLCPRSWVRPEAAGRGRY